MSYYADVLASLESIKFDESNALLFLKEFSSADLILVLEEILGRADLLTQVASDSYSHQLEFEKFVIAKSSTGSWLRIHRWPSQIKNAEQDIHSHCASFASKILQGSLAHKHYRKCDGEDYSEYRYHFDESTQVGASVYCGSTGVVHCGGDKQVTGDVYYVNKDLLHQVVEVEQGTVTVSIWGRRENDALVMQPDCVERKKTSARAGIESDKLTATFNIIINELRETNGFSRSEDIRAHSAVN